MNNIYTRNIPAISAEEQEILSTRSVLVVGCGGLGGYAVEYLSRLGVGRIVAVDGDSFSETNLNRQILSQTATLGKSKSEVAVERVHSINPDIEAIAVSDFLTADNAQSLLEGIDLTIDALDNVSARLILEDACAKAGINIVHGAVQGWNLQATVVLPGSNTLHSLYKASENDANPASDSSSAQDSHQDNAQDSYQDNAQDSPESKTCLCPTPACCAAIQAAEALKLLIGRESSLSGQMLFADLQTMESYTIPL